MYQNIRNLGSAVMLQAVKDYFRDESYRPAIIKDLKGEWMNFLTGGTSSVVAEQLKKNPGKIKRAMKKNLRLVGGN